jgi:hypothetical protein
MRPAVRALVLGTAILAVALLASLWLRTGPPRHEAASQAVAPVADPGAPAGPADAEERAAPPRRAGEEEPRAEADEPAPASLVPHRVLRQVSQDVVQDVSRRHRLVVIVVDPGISTRDLERLARDLRHAHQDASILDVRIYDAEHAARAAGVLETVHRVAEVRRNDRIGLDVVRIRGIGIEP